MLEFLAFEPEWIQGLYARSFEVERIQALYARSFEAEWTQSFFARSLGAEWFQVFQRLAEQLKPFDALLGHVLKNCVQQVRAPAGAYQAPSQKLVLAPIFFHLISVWHIRALLRLHLEAQDFPNFEQKVLAHPR